MPTAKKAAKKSEKKVPATVRVTGNRASEVSDASDAVDEQLARYQSMRDFSITAEPSGEIQGEIQGEIKGEIKGKVARAERTSSATLPFVIQKHAASHLHYDFRLGWKGVLKSWACAKGPSYFPGDRRLAVQVEDHPMAYGGFEGIIPQGQYGGGTVMVWDQGTWEPQAGHMDVDAGLRAGSLKFMMHGTKMKGNWTLVRMGGKAANEKKPNWLLIKEHDALEAGEGDEPITEAKPNSVVTGRTLQQIADNEDHVWNSKDTASKKGKAWFKKEKRGPLEEISPEVAKAPKEKLPEFIPPQLASEAGTVPSTDGWVHELKLDGYRIQARKRGTDVTLLTRSGLDWTHRMKPIASEVARLPVESAILDGEVVVLNEDGTTNFADLQAAFQEGAKKTLTYFAFDCLHADGRNLRNLPLLQRKGVLAKMLEGQSEAVRLSEHLEVDGETMFHKACELHAEGILSKRAGGAYVSGRTTDWTKSKCIHEQEFVVGGFTLPAKGHAGLHAVGSLLLGYYDADKQLIYAGRTGTGFTQKTHRLLRTQLESLKVTKGPFTDPPTEARCGAIWVKPELVAQVRFATWTASKLVRQASFQGLREDKSAVEVRLEAAVVKPLVSAGHRAAIRTAAKTSAAEGAKAAASTSSEPHVQVRLTHPEKVLDAESGLTKQQLADYYWAVAPYMLPQISGRPLSLVRCPEGSTKPCFFQKHTNSMLPPGIESVAVQDKKTGKPEPYLTLSTREALAGLAQMGVLEVHPWGSRNDDLERPDRIVIDLDPDAAIAWPVLAGAAKQVRKALKSIGLESFLKTTGGKGLHVVVPVEPSMDWAAVKTFAHEFVKAMEQADPALYLTKMSKAARKGKIYLDYLRNERGATAVAAYSPRARAGGPVSMPLAWSELDGKELPVFRVAEYAAWKGRLGRDPWKKMAGVRQRVGEAPSPAHAGKNAS